jgi:hypothetical protein
MSVDDKLSALLGAWVGEERIAASPWTEAGTASTTIEFTREVGGAVLQRYRQRRDGRETLTGLGVLDVDEGQVRHFWWDSLGQRPAAPATGRHTDEGIVLERSSPRGTNRTRIAIEGEELVYEVAFAAPGERPELLASGRYRRAVATGATPGTSAKLPEA